MARRMTGALHPWVSGGKSGLVRSHEGGRVCAHADCGTVLSIYNATEYCALHAHAAPDRRQRSQELLVREVVCAHCGTAFETTNRSRTYCSDRCRMAAFARRKRAALRSASRSASDTTL